MFESVLFICTGNICRSAMAEGMLRARAKAGLAVASAGTGALLGHPADPVAREVMHEAGIDIDAHRARQASPGILRPAGLILAMQRHHLEELSHIDPTVRGKSFLLGHWQGGLEIEDPYQQGRLAFERTYALLDESIQAWLRKI